MNLIRKVLKNKDGSANKIIAKSTDNYNIDINNNYQLVKFYKERKSFKDTILGSEIGFKSRNFASVIVISTLISVSAFILMVLSFRI